jgi:hypothetical protein
MTIATERLQLTRSVLGEVFLGFAQEDENGAIHLDDTPSKLLAGFRSRVPAVDLLYQSITTNGTDNNFNRFKHGPILVDVTSCGLS